MIFVVIIVIVGIFDILYIVRSFPFFNGRRRCILNINSVLDKKEKGKKIIDKREKGKGGGRKSRLQGPFGAI